MKLINRHTLLIGVSFLSLSLYAQDAKNKLNNPVLNMQDGAVERFMGYYYAIGQGTAGKIYTSKNLISWGNAVQAVTTNEAAWLNDPQWTQASVYKSMQAGDILYRNGVFHTYWNGIGHAYSATPLGPYKEGSINEPFDDYGIDVQVFQDENGDIYWVKKRNPADPHPMTGASSNIDGPEVWAFKMNTPFSRWDITLAGKQLSHQRGHPTSVNHVNFEGPEMFKYRGRYYILYASNRMGPRSGMYEVGVAESDAPMNFNNSKKYPHPVLARNTEQHLLNYNVILHTAEHGGWTSKYRTTAPAANWTAAGFDDSSWTTAQGGYGRQEYDLFGNTGAFTNAKIRARKTAWNTANIYIRRKFTLDKVPSKVTLKHWVFADANFYINGNKISIKTNNNTYSIMSIDPAMLVQGENIIAVEAASPCSDQICQQFIDFGLYDTRDKNAETIVIGQAQPNFVTGPNGFERWMMYKAYFNASQLQGIDRMHFYDKEAVVEPSSSLHSPGYHPLPSQPAFISYFDHPIYYPYEFLNGSEWKIAAGVLRPDNDAASELLLLTEPMTNYRYETPFRIMPGNGDYMGVYACRQDDDNWLKLRINRDNATWEYELSEQGNRTSQSFGLPANFKFLEDHPLVAAYEEPWHTLTVYKNGGDFKVELDYFNLTLNNAIHTGLTGSGKPGLLASSSRVSFDAIQYTGGFDEWDDKITGWEAKSGTWQAGANGLQQTGIPDKAVTLKGDKFRDYEFSVFMKNEHIPTAGKAGFYPLYVDENNYVEAGINYSTGKLEIVSNRNGNIEMQSVSLNSNIARQYTFASYPTTSYRYDFRSETEVSGVNILWFEGNYPYLSQTFDLPDGVKFYALQDNNTWQLLNAQLEGELRFAYFNPFTFDKVRTKAIRMEVTPKSGKAARAFSAYFREELASAYYLRARRENDRLFLFVNDSLKTTLEGDWEPSNVGLFTESIAATFNGILHYQGEKVAVTKIRVEEASCAVNETVRMYAGVEPVNATNKQVVWESSNPQIAGIDKDGKVTRYQAGTVTINAWAADGGLVKGSAVLGEASGTEAVKGSGISFYPNPVCDKLHILSDEPVEKVELHSVLGAQIIATTTLINNELDIAGAPAGVYLLNIQTANRKISNKIIKK